MIEKVFINQVDSEYLEYRVIVLQFLECSIIIQMIPFNGIMSVNYD